MRKGIPFRVVIVPSGPKGAFVIAPGDVFSTMVKTWPGCGLKLRDGTRPPLPTPTLPGATSLPYSPTLVPLRRIDRATPPMFLTESVESRVTEPHPVTSPTTPSPLRKGPVSYTHLRAHETPEHL